MKTFFIISIFLTSFFFYSNGQNPRVLDSLNQLLAKTGQDTNRVKLLVQIETEYFFTRPDTARIIAEKALALSRDLHYVDGIVTNLNELAEATRFLGNYPLALKLNFEALQMNRCYVPLQLVRTLEGRPAARMRTWKPRLWSSGASGERLAK